MRILSQTEINQISGGEIDTEGYNMSFLVGNSVAGAIIGTAGAVAYAVCFTDPFIIPYQYIGYTAGGFGLYALAMMAAKITDAYFFSPSSTTITPPASTISPPLS